MEEIYLFSTPHCIRWKHQDWTAKTKKRKKWVIEEMMNVLEHFGVDLPVQKK